MSSAVTSPYSLYSEKIASFDEDDSYNHHDAEGFINLYCLPIKVKAEMEMKLKGEM